MKEPTEFQYFKAWLMFFLVGTVGGALLGMILGSFVAAFLGAGGASPAQMTNILRVLGLIIGIPVSYFTFRIVLAKYLLPKIEDDSTPTV